jgi:hypothetical protein
MRRHLLAADPEAVEETPLHDAVPEIPAAHHPAVDKVLDDHAVLGVKQSRTDPGDRRSPRCRDLGRAVDRMGRGRRGDPDEEPTVPS